MVHSHESQLINFSRNPIRYDSNACLPGTRPPTRRWIVSFRTKIVCVCVCGDCMLWCVLHGCSVRSHHRWIIARQAVRRNRQMDPMDKPGTAFRPRFYLLRSQKNNNRHKWQLRGRYYSNGMDVAVFFRPIWWIRALSHKTVIIGAAAKDLMNGSGPFLWMYCFDKCLVLLGNTSEWLCFGVGNVTAGWKEL